MKDLDKKLFSIQVPEIDDNQFKEELKNRLIKKYHESKYQRKFHYALVYATFMMLFALGILLYPDIAIKINEFAFKKDIQKTEEIEKTEQLPTYENSNYAQDNFFDDLNTNDKFHYTSIYNPNLKNKIDPNKYKEDKTYVIRRYVSSDSQAVMIISEFNKKKPKVREVSF